MEDGFHECFSYLRNVQDLLSDGKTPYERRFGQPFKGPIIPFDSLVKNHPAELETVTTSRSPMTVMTANGEVQTHEESSESVDRQARADPFTSETSEELSHKPTEIPKPKKMRITNRNRETRIPTNQKGCENPERISWMIEFLNAETHTPVLLIKYLWSPHSRNVRIWVSTVFILTSIKTENAGSVRGPKLQESRAEDALADPTSCRKCW